MREWLLARKQVGREELEAMKYLVMTHEDGEVNGRENLAEWYTCEVRHHFLEWVRRELVIPKVLEGQRLRLPPRLTMAAGI